MANSLYITATEARSGKSVISLGVMEMLLSKIEGVGFFRPIVNPESSEFVDHDLHLIASHFGLEAPYESMYGCTLTEANRLFSMGREEEMIEGIIKKFSQLARAHDFILCEGTDFVSSSASFEFDINAEISKNLGCPVLLVARARNKSVDDTLRSIDLALDSLNDKGCQTIAFILNRLDPAKSVDVVRALKERGLAQRQLVYTIPEEVSLGKPTVAEVAAALDADVLYGKDQLNRHVHSFTVAAMQLRNLLTRIEHGSLIITPGDRAGVIVACLAAASSSSMDNISGILLTGGLIPEDSVQRLIKGFSRMVPILSVKENTYPTATRVDRIHATIAPDDDRKITKALAVFEQNVDVEALGERVVTTRTSTVTPKMFEYELLQRARAHKQHVVLPEGEEERILRAAEALLRRDIVNITLLGDESQIRDSITQLGLQMDGVEIREPAASQDFDDYVQTYYALRKNKGITMENAHDMMSDPVFFGTMMVYKGHADGMVSGAVHSTADTIRPALQIIRTKPGFTIVSSVNFMCLSDRVLVYGDCAVNPNPTARQLAEIAISAANTARTFGIDPIVAMLSYSTGESGKGEDVDRVREATKIAREMAGQSHSELKIEGPLQYDAAVDPGVAKTKLPRSDVAGKATVLIFPDLNTGNNTYKAVQRSAGAVAIGPVLQGLNRPVNDLSRGCTIPDIINTIAITAIQAQAEKGLQE